MENQIYHLVYLTTNLTNGKIYVGVHSTEVLEDGYLGSGKTLNKAIKKYGRDNFKRDILHFCLTSKDAYEIEKEIVNESFVKRKDIYNIVCGGNGGNITKHYTLEEKENLFLKISISLKKLKRFGILNPFYGKQHSKETKEKLSNKAQNRSEETRRRIIEANKNKIWVYKIVNDEVKRTKINKNQLNFYLDNDYNLGSNVNWSDNQKYLHSLKRKNKNWEEIFGYEKSIEMKNNLSNKNSGENNPFYGKHHTEETKEKLRYEKTPEHRRKISESGKGRIHSIESRQKMSESHKGKKKLSYKLSEEGRLKKKEAAQIRENNAKEIRNQIRKYLFSIILIKFNLL